MWLEFHRKVKGVYFILFIIEHIQSENVKKNVCKKNQTNYSLIRWNLKRTNFFNNI